MPFMRNDNSSKTAIFILNGIAVYFIVLFLYTAFSKIATFDTYRFDLARNPLIGKFAGPISVLLPFIEIVISFLLFFQMDKKLGWILSIILMSLFTFYVA